MIGGEHRKERFSERLEHAQNQPKNRGYIVGTEVKSAGYTPNTLAGNWFEERADAAFYDGKAVLPTENAKLWTTSYREMVRPVVEQALADGRQRPQPQSGFDQTTMIEVVDRSRSSYPAHQPHLDPRRQETASAAMHTVSQLTYVPPTVAEAAERTFVRPVLGGTPGAQANGVLLRLRRQVELGMPNRSAFPGNVVRGVRQALYRSVGSAVGASGSGPCAEVSARELQAGLAEVGVEASAPECTALITFFDTTGNGTASIVRLVDKLRGELTERRVQLIRSVYALLAALATAEAAEGRGDGLVRLRRVVDLVDVAQLPEVARGAVSAAEALKAFEEQWSIGDGAGPSRSFGCSKRGGSGEAGSDRLISEAAFVDYFADASFEIAAEGDFELLMRNIWHLSGGNGKCENTSCRRVEVIHLNGRVTREEVKNDLAIKSSDSGPDVDDLIRAKLEKQGIKDIKSFRVL